MFCFPSLYWRWKRSDVNICLRMHHELLAIMSMTTAAKVNVTPLQTSYKTVEGIQPNKHIFIHLPTWGHLQATGNFFILKKFQITFSQSFSKLTKNFTGRLEGTPLSHWKFSDPVQVSELKGKIPVLESTPLKKIQLTYLNCLYRYYKIFYVCFTFTNPDDKGLSKSVTSS